MNDDSFPLTEALALGVAALKARAAQLELDAELTNRHSQREPLVQMITRAQLAILRLDAERMRLEAAQPKPQGS